METVWTSESTFCLHRLNLGKPRNSLQIRDSGVDREILAYFSKKKKSTQEGPEEAEEAKERAKGQKKEPSRGQRGEVGGQRGLWRSFGVNSVNGNAFDRLDEN